MMVIKGKETKAAMLTFYNTMQREQLVMKIKLLKCTLNQNSFQIRQ